MSWTHPCGRKSSTGWAISILRQSRELLDKPTDIISANIRCWAKEYVLVWFGNPINLSMMIIALYRDNDDDSDDQRSMLKTN